MTVQPLTWEEVRAAAREKLQGICALCRVCDGRSCVGQVPGIGGVGTGAGFINNYEALKAVHLNLRTLHAVSEPELSAQIFGTKLALPVLGAAVAGAKINFGGRISEWDFTWAQVKGAYDAGTVALTGDGAEAEEYAQGLEAIRAVGGAGIPIIKPRPPEEIIQRIRQAEEVRPLAVGIDVDAAGLISMRRSGQPVGPVGPATLERICSSTSLPVLIKGIMTVDEALAAYEAGAAGIVVSNHGGRTLDHTPGTAAVLPDIAAAVKGKLILLADGGVRSGVDVLKFLALGADAVLVGRPAAWAAFGGGPEGVRLLYQKLADELKVAMILTGCQSPAAANERLVKIN